jgi:hypothetical protein
MGRIRLGEATEAINDSRGRMEMYLEWRDIWVGAFISPDAVYICPLPLCVIRISRGRKP